MQEHIPSHKSSILEPTPHEFLGEHRYNRRLVDSRDDQAIEHTANVGKQWRGHARTYLRCTFRNVHNGKVLELLGPGHPCHSRRRKQGPRVAESHLVSIAVKQIQNMFLVGRHANHLGAGRAQAAETLYKYMKTFKILIAV